MLSRRLWTFVGLIINIQYIFVINAIHFEINLKIKKTTSLIIFRVNGVSYRGQI